ncbi:inactive poly [ADP-ribose] polymerase RCD1-like isoform X2 [Phragmites australis]|uniref:inactive poly [ADP-ribose] polymerase RCD1-like isoform X2 n=1 Tax=Phragmites australis TaxID=29695 RepID=UPI002D787174|nr:inactive poly [ADP-ribose] polymerase RCD1-like isoform X2 [Phragmites australis]
MASLQESNSLCLKRKLVDDCLSKDCKSRRVKSENWPSFDSSAKRCNCCCTRPNLASDCVNFLKSEVPSCIMYYKQGSWHNFPEQIMKSLVEKFRGNKSSFVVVMDNEPLLVDFLSMTLVNLKTRKQRSVAWFDDTGKRFSPSLFFDEESDEMTKGGSGNIDSTAQGIMLDKAANSPPEVVKQVVLESSPPVPQKPSTTDVLRKKMTSVERGSEGFLFVQDLFLSGMGSFATPSSILHVHRYSPNDITAQCRFEAFERQMRSTKEECGDANVRYGWIGSRKNDIVRILINGLGTTVKSVEKAGLSAGVYLSPENRAFTSVGLCDVDRKGVQYMLLCRVILGNMEAVEPGSQESFPSSEIYDSGVDDCSNPKCYVMWPSHLSTHMRLEYLVSFKLVPKVQNYLLGLKGLWFHPSPKEVAVDISSLQHVMCETGAGPASPWISFRVLFGVIQDSISSVARELFFHHYEELKESKITREEMVKNMIIIVGEKILLEALKKLHYCPSLWYKPSVEAVSSDSARATPEQLSLDETVLSTKRCDTLATDMVPKGHDCLAPSSVTETSSSAGATCRGSPSVEPEGRDSPIQIMSPGNSAARCVKNQDSFVARVAPIVCDGLLSTISGRSASPSVEVCNSVTPTTGPPGNVSVAPTNASKTHGILAPGFTPKGCESTVPSLAFGNSEGRGVKRLNSSPRMTPEGQEFLALGIASKGPARHSVEGQVNLTPVAIPPVHTPGRGNSPSMSTEGRDSLALSITPKGHDGPASIKLPKRCESPRSDTLPESGRPKAQDAATKVYNAPTPVTGEPKDQIAPCGSQNKSSGPGLDGSSHVTGATNAIVALSTLREKGGH